jgi:surface antigen
MSDTIKAAFIAAVAAFGGTIVGGVVAYLSSHDLQVQQMHREQAREAIAARAVARLMTSELDRQQGWLALMTAEKEFMPTPYRQHVFVSQIDQSDRKLVAGSVSEANWTTVAVAARAAEDVQIDLETHRGRGDIGGEESQDFERATKRVEEAKQAMTPLAEGKTSG